MPLLHRETRLQISVRLSAWIQWEGDSLSCTREFIYKNPAVSLAFHSSKCAPIFEGFSQVPELLGNLFSLVETK